MGCGNIGEQITISLIAAACSAVIKGMNGDERVSEENT
jgi:hypothetical protein